MLARESLGSPLTVLGSSSSTSISTLLQNGGNEEDIAWYDVFEEICRDKDPSGTGALVALTTTLKKQENEVRGSEDEATACCLSEMFSS